MSNSRARRRSKRATRKRRSPVSPNQKSNMKEKRQLMITEEVCTAPLDRVGLHVALIFSEQKVTASLPPGHFAQRVTIPFS